MWNPNSGCADDCCPPAFRRDKLNATMRGEPRGDIVLLAEEVAARLVERLRPRHDGHRVPRQ